MRLFNRAPNREREGPTEGRGRGEATVVLRARLKRVDWRNYVVYLGFIAILLFFAIAVGGRGFLSTTNLMNIVRQTAPVSVMAVGMAFALSAGEIDLSIGAVGALAAVVNALLPRGTKKGLAPL